MIQHNEHSSRQRGAFADYIHKQSSHPTDCLPATLDKMQQLARHRPFRVAQGGRRSAMRVAAQSGAAAGQAPVITKRVHFKVSPVAGCLPTCLPARPPLLHALSALS